MKKLKLIIFSLSILMTLEVFSEQIKLTLDIEIKEPGNIIFNRIRDIATDSKSNIYVLDSKEKMVFIFNEEGVFLKKIGSPGQGPGELNKPRSIYIDSKDIIYIFDGGNRRVEIFDSEANYFKSITSNDFPSGGGSQIVVDKSGELYISGYYRGKDSVFILCLYK
jgi:DNA-binding beta-propeller fold protein YncE